MFRYLENQERFQNKENQKPYCHFKMKIFEDDNHPFLRVLVISTILVLGLLIMIDLFPWTAFGFRTRRKKDNNIVLISLAIIALFVEWIVYYTLE